MKAVFFHSVVSLEPSKSEEMTPTAAASTETREKVKSEEMFKSGFQSFKNENSSVDEEAAVVRQSSKNEETFIHSFLR